MEHVYSEVPLALFTTFSLIGAGSFAVLAVLINVFRLEEKQLRNIDVLSIMPTLAVLLGFVAAFFGFQDHTEAVVLLSGLNNAMRIASIGMGALLAATACAYCVQANFVKLPGGRRRLLVSLAGGAGLVFVCIVGVAHMAAGGLGWGTLATPMQMLGFALLGGSALVSLVLEKADALEAPVIKRTLVVISVLGIALGVGGFAAQITAVLGMASAGADAVRSVSLHIAVGTFCLVATFVFEAMAVHMKETGFHSVLAVACAFAGVFCARLVFYAL